MTEAKVPANLAPYVQALGTAGAVDFFLRFGGSQIYLPRTASERSKAAKEIGIDKVARLAEAMGDGYIKVPLARQWIAAKLRAKGESDNEIARIVRADVATVRRWLGSKSAAEQLTFPI